MVNPVPPSDPISDFFSVYEQMDLQNEVPSSKSEAAALKNRINEAYGKAIRVLNARNDYALSDDIGEKETIRINSEVSEERQRIVNTYEITIGRFS